MPAVVVISDMDLSYLVEVLGTIESLFLRRIIVLGAVLILLTLAAALFKGVSKFLNPFSHNASAILSITLGAGLISCVLIKWGDEIGLPLQATNGIVAALLVGICAVAALPVAAAAFRALRYLTICAVWASIMVFLGSTLLEQQGQEFRHALPDQQIVTDRLRQVALKWVH